MSCNGLGKIIDLNHFYFTLTPSIVRRNMRQCLQVERSKNMSKAKKISNNEYSYKGYIIARYENARGAVRWMVELSGREVRADLSRKWVAVDYIDQHPVPA